LFYILQFSFRSKEKLDKKKVSSQSGLRELYEENDSNDSDQRLKVEAMSAADVDRLMEQMLVCISSVYAVCRI